MRGGHNRTHIQANSNSRLDLKYFKQYLKPNIVAEGSTGWINPKTKEDTGTIGIRFYKCELIELKYTVKDNYTGEKESIEEKINLEKTKCNYGGYRYWFVCPRCNEKYRILYIRNNRYRCRFCNKVNYYIQQANKDGGLMQVREKMSRIEKKLKHDEYAGYYPHSKPKGMHWNTYNELMNRRDLLIDKENELFCKVSIKRFGMIF